MNFPILTSHTNGNTSPLSNSIDVDEDAAYKSESDLSDIRDPAAVEATSLSTSPHHQSEFGNQDLESAESSESENQDASDDADFDMEDSPAPVTNHNARVDRSSSHDSRRPTKRKLGVEDD
jgi:chromodomain-helicase-DNA-binding protein 1